MNQSKLELCTQYQKSMDSLYQENRLMTFPAALSLFAFVLYAKPKTIGLFVALGIFGLYTTIVFIFYLKQVSKLEKEYEQQMAELDAEE